MPRTKLQEIVYAVLMTLFMVLAIELYNTRLRIGGMTNAGFFYDPFRNADHGARLFCDGIFSWSGSPPKSPLKW